jgi:hypothetical protein
MFMRLEIEPSAAATTRVGDRIGLFVDATSGCVRLRWPKAVTDFPFGVAWIEMLWGEWAEGQGLMAVALDKDGSHYIGAISLADLDMTTYIAEGLRPEASSIHEEDLDLISPTAIARLLKEHPVGTPLRAALERLQGMLQKRIAGRTESDKY